MKAGRITVSTRKFKVKEIPTPNAKSGEVRIGMLKKAKQPKIVVIMDRLFGLIVVNLFKSRDIICKKNKPIH